MNKAVFWLFFCQILLLVGCPSLDGQAQQERLSVNSKTQKQQQNKWQPATYRGLTMGKSTRDDMLRVFGEPEDFSEYKKLEKNRKPDAEIPYFYDNAGEFPGGLIVGVNNSSKKIVSIRLRPEKLSKEEALRHFGSDYVVTRYGTDDCIDGTEAVPIFESPDGTWVLIEYRERGIIFHTNDGGQVDEISYISEPPGSPSSKCKK